MAKTNNTITIEGKECVMNFTCNYFLRYFQEATGVDLIAGDELSVASVKIYDYLSGFIYAGHKAECSLNKKPCEITKEDAEHYVMSMSTEEAVKMMTDLGVVQTISEKNGNSQAGKKKK
jgi:hypothetical protein